MHISEVQGGKVLPSHRFGGQSVINPTINLSKKCLSREGTKGLILNRIIVYPPVDHSKNKSITLHNLVSLQRIFLN